MARLEILFDALTIVGLLLLFSDTPILGVGMLVVAGVVWLWLCPDPYNVNDLED